MSELIKWEAARRALAEARSVDEVKDIRDQSIAMQLYAKLSKDRQMQADAWEIRIRSERRLGGVMEAQKETVGFNEGTKGSRVRGARVSEKPTLSEAGIDKNLAHRARKLSAMSDQNFEKMVVDGRDQLVKKGEKIINDLVAPPRKSKGQSVPALNPSSWAKATPEQRREFVQAVKPSAILAAVGARAFYRGLTGQQKGILMQRSTLSGRRNSLVPPNSSHSKPSARQKKPGTKERRAESQIANGYVRRRFRHAQA
jgi:hypothetical protein